VRRNSIDKQRVLPKDLETEAKSFNFPLHFQHQCKIRRTKIHRLGK
jgi:hypothetical protein